MAAAVAAAVAAGAAAVHESEDSLEPPRKRATGGVEILECPLPTQDAIATKILAELFPSPAFGKLVKTCRYFYHIRLHAIHTHLKEKTTLTADEVIAMRLPLYHYLIQNNPDFTGTQTEAVLHTLWDTYSYPHVFAYAIFNCSNLKELDLRHNHYSFLTFFGQLEPFYPSEVQTQIQGTDPNFQKDDEAAVKENLAATFHSQYPLAPSSITKLSIRWHGIDESDDPWGICATNCPHLTTLVIERKKSYTQDQIDGIFARILSLTSIEINGTIIHKGGGGKEDEDP